MSHSESGGLSTVMKLPGSSEPEKNAFQEVAPALHEDEARDAAAAARGDEPDVLERARGVAGEPVQLLQGAVGPAEHEDVDERAPRVLAHGGGGVARCEREAAVRGGVGDGGVR